MKLNIIESFVNYCNSMLINNDKDISFSNSYKDALFIIKSLSKKEQELMNIHSDDDYSDSDTTIYREVLKVNGIPVAVIDVDNYETYKHIGFISIASNPKYRKHGYAKMLLNRFMHSDIPSNITKLCYSYHEDNDVSKYLAISNGFSKPLKGDDGYITASLLVSKIKSRKDEISVIVKNIYRKVKKDEKEPVGNQNCQLCTWCTEAQIRGINILPRPVYSPRDILFTLNGYDIVKESYKEKITSVNDVVNKLRKSGLFSRYYVHVNWKGSSGGHEFMVINLSNDIYIIDSQASIIADINSEKGKCYFNDINFNNSFIVRMDNKELNKDILKYNNDRYITYWDERTDIEYMKKNNMI